jgi:hypothetical protein
MKTDARVFNFFNPCSHLNPIDPAEYSPEAFEDVLPQGASYQPAHRPLEPRDRIVTVAPEDWRECFEGLCRSHEGWLASLSHRGGEAGARTQVRDLPLVGVVQEPKLGTISIRLGPLVHFVREPSRVWLRIGPGGEEKALGIDSNEGSLLLGFRSALPTEMVDGIAPFPDGRPGPTLTRQIS